MPENREEKKDSEKKPETAPENPSWADDQKTRSYYYDDACGYETFDAEADESEPDEDL